MMQRPTASSLLRGLRGRGDNFRVVTSFEFALHSVTEVVAGSDSPTAPRVGVGGASPAGDGLRRLAGRGWVAGVSRAQPPRSGTTSGWICRTAVSAVERTSVTDPAVDMLRQNNWNEY